MFVVLSSCSLSRASTSSLSLSTCSLSCSSTSMTSEPSRIKTIALTHNEEYCTVAIYNLSHSEAAIPTHRFTTSLNYHICQPLLSSVLAHQCWPNGQLPDCVLSECVSRNRQSLTSVWRSSPSTMSVRSFEFVRFFLCTSVPDNIDHWSICTPHYCLHTNVQ